MIGFRDGWRAGICLLTVGLGLLVAPWSFAEENDSISLMADGTEQMGWRFDNGQEFKGATGSLTIDSVNKFQGHDTLKLTGDFSNGGTYVRANATIPSREINEISMYLLSPMRDQITMRIIDSAKQCHQITIKVPKSDQWQKVVFPLARFFKAKEGSDAESVDVVTKYESWGGPADGKWRGPATSLDLIIGPTEKDKIVTLGISGVNISAKAAEAVTIAPYSEDFEDFKSDTWKVEGKVAVDGQGAFKGTQSLCLNRSVEDVEKPCSVQGPTFPVKPGLWDISGATKCDLKSPGLQVDSSFDGVVTLQVLDANGKGIDSPTLADVFGKKDWDAFERQIEIPKNGVSARFQMQLNKASGKLWVDQLLASFTGEAPHKFVDRLVFTTASEANMLYPTDSRSVHLKVRAFEELPEAQRSVSFDIRDYWGAEQMKPVQVPLKQAANEKVKDVEYLVYEGDVDLKDIALEQGRYYEMNGEIALPGKPFRNHSGVAILPEAPNNALRPEDAPFTGRNWDGSIGEAFTLSRRMGIRIMNLWSNWQMKPPYTPTAPCIDLAAKYDMGVIFRVPTGPIERHTPGWEKFTNEAFLRGGIDSTIEKFGKTTQPVWFSLGNEPPTRPDFIENNVKAYAILYDEIKKKMPTAFVSASSAGPSEEFFKGGFGKYCDAYDFHDYDDPSGVTKSFEKYRELFKKYGNEKPIISTEIGLNAQGVAHHAIAVIMAKKYALFYAGGGTSISWFDLMYPDPNAKIAGTNGESFNVFDCRYVAYNPKITAVTYYDVINSIGNKKFIGEKKYDTDIRAFLLRNKANNALQVLWKDAGRKDAFIPLPDVHKVEVVLLDGTHRTLDAEGKGITLTLNEDPVMLLYDGTAPLAETLGEPSIQIASVPAGIVGGRTADITVMSKGAPTANIELNAPPFWEVQKKTAAESVVFTVKAPAGSNARAGELMVMSGNTAGSHNAQLDLRLPVTAQVTTAITPVPPADGKPPGVKLLLSNNGINTKDLNWDITVVDQMPLISGYYEPHEASQAKLAGTPKGSVSLEPGASKEIVLPLTGVDSQDVYHVRSTVHDSTGDTVIRERNVAGFVAVPKAKTPLKLDGLLDEADWKNAPVEHINEARQYHAYSTTPPKWKGPDDLSATLRFLWDDKYLYLGVDVIDDIAGSLQDGPALWKQDGLQMLIDPCRGLDESVGKYDYFMGVGKNGPQAWCGQTADVSAPSGEVKDIVLSFHRKDAKTGSTTYEVAIPWTRIAPFKPGVGADLGLTLILNEDDGKGRYSFMTWFGDAHNKQIGPVGDLILGP